jgi:hypothetical protein
MPSLDYRARVRGRICGVSGCDVSTQGTKHAYCPVHLQYRVIYHRRNRLLSMAASVCYRCKLPIDGSKNMCQRCILHSAVRAINSALRKTQQCILTTDIYQDDELEVLYARIFTLSTRLQAKEAALALLG